MNTYRIAVIPGDGIGKETIKEGMKVLQATAELHGGLQFRFDKFPWGSEYYLSHGQMMPSDGLNTLRDFDAIYFGAVGSLEVPDHISLRGLRLAICQGFDQYVNLRPSRLLPGVESPLRLKGQKAIDFIVIRENTEGEYSGVGGRIHRGFASETALETTIFTRSGVERVMRFAYEFAQSRPRRLLSSVTKSNAQEHIFTMWDEIFDQIGRDYPEVQTERVLVDAMAARFVLHPESLEVVVASNLFADILTDLGGAICGSLGVAPSGNINPERDYPSMFEPIHGSALDIYGRGIANPIGMIWSGAMMLEFLGEGSASGAILQAIMATTTKGRFMSPDLGGNASTKEVGDAIVDNLLNLA